jgi:hypothetical protein
MFCPRVRFRAFRLRLGSAGVTNALSKDRTKHEIMPRSAFVSMRARAPRLLLAALLVVACIAQAQNDPPTSTPATTQMHSVAAQATDAAGKPGETAVIRIYRKDRFFAMGSKFAVEVDGRPIGELPNASYMDLVASTGAHTVTIKPAPLVKPFNLGITAVAGKTSYVEFDLNGGLFANSFFIGSELVQRADDVATNATKALKEASVYASAKPGGAMSLSEAAANQCTAVEMPRFPYRLDETGWASLNDAGALPSQAQKGYAEFLGEPYPRAFAVARSGVWAHSSTTKDAVEIALANCARSANATCYLYAIDGKVVFTGRSAAGACWGIKPVG